MAPRDTRVRASVEIAATPKRVFFYLRDQDRVKRWQHDVVETQPLPERLQTGMLLRSTIQEYGRRFEVEVRVAALAANEYVGYEMEAPTASVRSEYRLVLQGANTRVESTAVIQPKGFARFLLPLLGGLIRRKLRSRLQLLREVVEADRTFPE